MKKILCLFGKKEPEIYEFTENGKVYQVMVDLLPEIEENEIVKYNKKSTRKNGFRIASIKDFLIVLRNLKGHPEKLAAKKILDNLREVMSDNRLCTSTFLSYMELSEASWKNGLESEINVAHYENTKFEEKSQEYTMYKDGNLESSKIDKSFIKSLFGMDFREAYDLMSWISGGSVSSVVPPQVREKVWNSMVSLRITGGDLLLASTGLYTGRSKSLGIRTK